LIASPFALTAWCGWYGSFPSSAEASAVASSATGEAKGDTGSDEAGLVRPVVGPADPLPETVVLTETDEPVCIQSLGREEDEEEEEDEVLLASDRRCSVGAGVEEDAREGCAPVNSRRAWLLMCSRSSSLMMVGVPGARER
jgi:hypothetical protein